MANSLVGLNEQQRKVVEAIYGPVLVLAGAGSGKTRALTHRIAHILQNKLSDPENILAVTFTNKAAAEMRERVAQLTGSQEKTPTAISTFHSLGAKILREQYRHLDRTAGFTILDSGDSERMVKQSLDSLGMSAKQWPPKQIRNKISRAKNDLLSPVDIEAGSGSYDDEVVAKVFSKYQRLLAQHDAYDFDDLIAEPIKLLDSAMDVRRVYQLRWQFVSVDEYQDTNPAQDALLKLLLNDDKNLCVVGDDYQAIYSWRGAKVDHILKFEKRYPNCTTIYLTQNYRSTPKIIEAANVIIAENKTQKHKELWTDIKKGSPVQVACLATDYDEAKLIGHAVENYISEGGNAEDIAVLYRTNAQSRLFEEYFVRHHIPYVIIGGIRFYERAEVKDALALLQLWVNPNNLLSLKRLTGVLARGVGPKTIDKLAEQARETGLAPAQLLRATGTLTDRQEAGLAPLKRALLAADELDPETARDILSTLVTVSGLVDHLKRLPDGDERLENIDELLSVAARHKDAGMFLEEAALMSDSDTAKKTDGGQGRVSCMTLHAAKGLEFKNVFVAGCEENLLPHRNSQLSEKDIEEERRLLYVGMTRARESLTLTYASLRSWHGETTPQLPSRFLESLPEGVERLVQPSYSTAGMGSGSFTAGSSHVPIRGNGENSAVKEAVYEEREVGDLIQHPIFGRGVVIEVQGSTVTCVFEGHGMKTISV